MGLWVTHQRRDCVWNDMGTFILTVKVPKWEITKKVLYLRRLVLQQPHTLLQSKYVDFVFHHHFLPISVWDL